MAELRGRRNNYARGGRRVYAPLNRFEAVQTPEWETRPRAWKAPAPTDEERRSRADSQSGPWNNRKLQDADNWSFEVRTESEKIPSDQGTSSKQSDCEGFQDVEVDLRRAAALLLDRASNILFEDLCELCSASLKHRLASIASGALAAEGALVDVKDSRDGEGKHSCNGIVEERDKKFDVTARQEGNNRRMGSTANNIIKSALRSIRDAPAYRTRSQAGLLSTSDQVSSESASDSKDQQRMLEVGRKKDFCSFDRVNGQQINVLEGLELHTNVLNTEEQKELIDYVYELQELGRNQKLRRRTYSEPRKWMRGKGRVTIQFGCCYNYAVDKDGNPPGIIRDEEVDEMPPKFCTIIKRLVEWQVLPPSCIPDSCIVNIYDVGDCIPPHIDHHDFLRPFCTLSLLSECNIIFGTNLKIAGPGEFIGSSTLPLPTGSVLILNGNGADVAKHAVPAVPTQRISITFRKMDPTKVPVAFRLDTELLSTRPLPPNRNHAKLSTPSSVSNFVDDSGGQSLDSDRSHYSLESDFPTLGRNGAPGRSAPDGRFRVSRA